MSSMLKLKTSQPSSNKVTQKKDNKKNAEAANKNANPHIEEDDHENQLIDDAKKIEKKNIQPAVQEGWQSTQDMNKDLLVPSTGSEKKPVQKRQEEGVQIRQEEFPDIEKIDNWDKKPETKKSKPKEQQQQTSIGMFTNSRAMQRDPEPKKPEQNSGFISFTNSLKDESAQKVQQPPERKPLPPPQEPPQQPEQRQPEPPKKPMIQLSRSTASSQQPQAAQAVPEKKAPQEEAVPTFINSNAKAKQQIAKEQEQLQNEARPTIQKEVAVQQSKPQPQAEEEEEGDDGWQTVEVKKSKKHTPAQNPIRRKG